MYIKAFSVEPSSFKINYFETGKLVVWWTRRRFYEGLDIFRSGQKKQNVVAKKVKWRNTGQYTLQGFMCI